MDLYSAFASDTRMNNQVNTYNNSTLKKNRFSIAKAIKGIQQRNTKRFRQVEHSPKYTTSFGYPVNQNQKCAYRCN
jgi:hypothetical protein